MRKNQQGGNPKSGSAAGSQTQPAQSISAAGNQTAPAPSIQPAGMAGFSQAAAEHQAVKSHHLGVATPSFLQPPGAERLTPHHTAASHLSAGQNLASQIGLASPLGLGAISSGAVSQPVYGGASKSSINSSASQMAFSQLLNSQDKTGQLTTKQIDQIGKELEYCATHGDADEMQELLARHQDVIQKKVLNVALRAAVKGCTTPKLEYSIQCCQLLVEAGANINSEEANEGKTALMMSCQKGYLELVKNLLDNEALIDHKDQQKRTSLMYAINTNAQNEDVVQELLNRGADVNDQTLTGLTPLLLAVKKSHTRICKLLLSRGADIKAQFPEDMNSSLHYACIQGNIMTLNILLEHSRKKLSEQLTQEFLYLLNKNSKTALQIADEKHSENPDSNAYQQIYSEMSLLYQQKEKAVDEIVETLLKKEKDSSLLNDAHASGSAARGDQIGTSGQQNPNSAMSGNNLKPGKRQGGGGRNQLARGVKVAAQAATSSAVDAIEQPPKTQQQDQKLELTQVQQSEAANTSLDADVEYQNERTAPPDLASKSIETPNNEIKAELESAVAQQQPSAQTSKNTNTASSSAKPTKQSKKAKKQGKASQQQQMNQASFAEVVQAAYSTSTQQQQQNSSSGYNNEPSSQMSDEDDFKSAESKTPPSQKAGESDTTATVGATTRYGGKATSSQLNGKPAKSAADASTRGNGNADADGSDTVTEHSSDEDHFVDTCSTMAPTAAMQTVINDCSIAAADLKQTSNQQQPTAAASTKQNKSQKKPKKKTDEHAQQQTAPVNRTAQPSTKAANNNFSSTNTSSMQNSQQTASGKKLTSQQQNNSNNNQRQHQQQTSKQPRDGTANKDPKSSGERGQKITASQSAHQQDTSSLPPWMQQPTPAASTSHKQQQNAAKSQGAVQKPIVNQQNQTANTITDADNDDDNNSWPQVLIQKLSAAASSSNHQATSSAANTYENSQSASNINNNNQHQSSGISPRGNKQKSNSRKQNAAVVENLNPPEEEEQLEADQRRRKQKNRMDSNAAGSTQPNELNNQQQPVSNTNQQQHSANSPPLGQQQTDGVNNNHDGESASYAPQQSYQQQPPMTSASGGGIPPPSSSQFAGGGGPQQFASSGQYQQQQQQIAPAARFNPDHNNLSFNPPPQNHQVAAASGGGQPGSLVQGAKPGSAPITLFKNLDNRKTQFDFILEQQEMRNKMLTFQLYSHKEKMREIELDVKLRKQDHIVRVNEYYNQAQRYYENFRELETQMNDLADTNDKSLKGSLSLLGQLRDATGGQQQSEDTAALIRQIEENLHDMDATNKKFTDEIGYRKENEKTYMQTQTDKRMAEEKNVKEQSNLQADMALMKETQATKQSVAKTQIQYNNLFIEMETAYGEEGEQSLYHNSSRYPQQVFNKLHDEVILFDESVKSIMDEVEPIKKIIIDKISGFIKQVIPNGDVEVYGSHATKLCLHWSDIDLVLKPAPKDRDQGSSHRGGDEQQPHMYSNQRDGAGGMHYGGGGAYQPSGTTNMRNWLNMLYNELIKSENRGWLQKVDFIENTTVPVIKLACSYHHLSQAGSGQLLLPNGQVPRYPAIVTKPINVDITLWSENHNGLPCVKLVKSYLAESQLIEPLILVLKQILKVWGFNDAYTGGLSSYALFLMIVSFLQEKRKPVLKSDVNLGETLLELIRYYAQLDFSQYAICCKMPGEQSDKQNLYQNINTDYNFFMQPRIVIDDPLMASNNVGKSAFRFQEIKNIMSHAYNSVFTGCFCSCHIKTMCRNTSFHQNPRMYHRSQLLSSFGAYQGQTLPQAPHYFNYQHPPNNSSYSNTFGSKQQNSSLGFQQMGTSAPAFNSISAQASAKQLPESANSMAASNATEDPQSQTATSSTNNNQNTNRAPYPADMALLRTQSQPFQIGSSRGGGGDASSINLGNSWQGQNQFYNQNIAHQSQIYSDMDVNCSCDSILARLIYGYNNYRRTMESLHPNFGTLQMGGLQGLSGMPFMSGNNL